MSDDQANNGPTIYVDADACPVKTEIEKVGERHALAIVYVANSGLRPSRDPRIRVVTVSDSFDAADDWIVENALSGDIAITADIPLAARLVENKVHVLTPTGRQLNSTNMGMVLASRNLSQDLREAGTINSYNAPFSKKDRSNFLQTLELTIRRAKS